MIYEIFRKLLLLGPLQTAVGPKIGAATYVRGRGPGPKPLVRPPPKWEGVGHNTLAPPPTGSHKPLYYYFLCSCCRWCSYSCSCLRQQIFFSLTT